MTKPEKYILERPKDKSIYSDTDLIESFQKNKELIEKANSPIYLHWKELKWKTEWLPRDKEKFWHIVKATRYYRKSYTLIESYEDKEKNFFTWVNLPRFQNFLHKFDLGIGGDIVANKTIDAQERKIIIRQSIIEEAIASSQVEGAHTSRKVAKEMIKFGRKPRDSSEQMIYNNYRAMERITECKDENLSLELILELHQILTKDDKTLKENEIGRFRDDEVYVTDGEFCYYEAPDPKFVQRELTKLIELANAPFSEDGSFFIHPVIEAIMLHFWISYLHPFVDGNGRLARCLFYWYMLKKGYWIISYLPISRIIKKSPKQYGMSFVYTEQDDSDLTYFIDYNIRKIQQAQKEFEEYYIRRIKETEKEEEINKNLDLNERQVQILRSLENGSFVTNKGYINIFDISKPTGISDLKDLERKDLIRSEKSGREVRYYKKIGKI
ncbi:Fic family protein [Pseudomonadota bacterium]